MRFVANLDHIFDYSIKYNELRYCNIDRFYYKYQRLMNMSTEEFIK